MEDWRRIRPEDMGMDVVIFFLDLVVVMVEEVEMVKKRRRRRMTWSLRSIFLERKLVRDGERDGEWDGVL